MNAARIAALLRELADEFDEGASGGAGPPPKRAATPRRRRRRVAAPLPDHPPSELDVARARAAARRAGIVVR
jgi:hypothetical protein